MSKEKAGERAKLDRMASDMVKQHRRDHGIKLDYTETRDRLRRNLVRSEQKKPRQ